MASDGSDIFIWWGSGSAPCWRVLVTLQEKQLTKYGEKVIQFSKKEHKAPDVLAVNPRGQVPTIKHGDTPINNSLAACLYFEEVFKGQGLQLVPDSPAEKALVLQRYQEAPDNIQPKIADFFAKSSKSDEEGLKETKKGLADELKRWEGYLAQIGDGAYIAGKNFSLADTTFFTFLAFFVRLGLKLDSTHTPNLKAYYERVEQRPSVQKTWPPHWKESAGQDTLAAIFDL